MNEQILAPGVYDGLSAMLAEQAGFKAVYASGGAIARASGRPDIGLLSLAEVSAKLAEIVSAVNIPVIADADTGFGNELNVVRTVQEFERAGVWALHIEDQTFPKRCGHLSGKSLIPPEDMGIKIAAALAARKRESLLIIARTDAIAVEGFAKAIERANYYAEIGADVLFVEAPESREQIEQIAKAVSKPKLINMFYGGKTPLIPLKDLQQMGYQFVIIPSDLQRAAIFAMQRTLHSIFDHGDSREQIDQMASFKEREAILGTKTYFDFAEALKAKIAKF